MSSRIFYFSFNLALFASRLESTLDKLPIANENPITPTISKIKQKTL